jgi:hypothetical protein
MVLQSTLDKNNLGKPLPILFCRIWTLVTNEAGDELLLCRRFNRIRCALDKHSLSSKPHIAFQPRVRLSSLHVVFIVEKRINSDSNITDDPLKLTLVLMPCCLGGIPRPAYNAMKMSLCL